MSIQESQPKQLKLPEQSSEFRLFDVVGNHWVISGHIDRKYFIREVPFSVVEAVFNGEARFSVAAFSDELEALAFFIHKD